MCSCSNSRRRWYPYIDDMARMLQSQAQRQRYPRLRFHAMVITHTDTSSIYTSMIQTCKKIKPLPNQRDAQSTNGEADHKIYNRRKRAGFTYIHEQSPASISFPLRKHGRKREATEPLREVFNGRRMDYCVRSRAFAPTHTDTSFIYTPMIQSCWGFDMVTLEIICTNLEDIAVWLRPSCTQTLMNEPGSTRSQMCERISGSKNV